MHCVFQHCRIVYGGEGSLFLDDGILHRVLNLAGNDVTKVVEPCAASNKYALAFEGAISRDHPTSCCIINAQLVSANPCCGDQLCVVAVTCDQNLATL